MASYFWVGGTGSWDNASTANWSTLSGGASGAGPPTSADTVTFDGSSGLTTTQIVTVAATAACGGCSISGIAGKEVTFQFSGSPTWSAGTYSFQGTATVPIWFRTNSNVAQQRTLTINGTHGTHAHIDFMDMALAGTAGTLTGTGIGDCLGNGAGITFDAPATQTWVGTSGGLWSNVANWTSRIPLPQDPVVISSAFIASQTVTFDMSRLGASIDSSSATGGPTLARSGGTTNMNNHVFGSFLMGPSVAINGGQSVFFRGRSSHTFQPNTTNGWGFSVLFRAITGTYTMTASWGSNTGFSGSVSVVSGTLDTNGFSVLCRGNFTVQPDGTQINAVFLGRAGNHQFGGNSINNGFVLNGATAFASGTGTWSLIGTGTVWQYFIGATFTGLPTLLITDSSATAKTFNGANATYGIVRATPGTGGLVFGFGNYQFSELSISGGGVPVTVTTTVGQSRKITVSGGILTLRGQPGNPLTIASSNVGTQATFVVADGTAYNIGDDTPTNDIVFVLPGGAANPVGHRVSVLNR